MPDKEGDDEKKSTKSVVNKKQKQMMNQEDFKPLPIDKMYDQYDKKREANLKKGPYGDVKLGTKFGKSFSDTQIDSRGNSKQTRKMSGVIRNRLMYTEPIQRAHSKFKSEKNDRAQAAYIKSLMGEEGYDHLRDMGKVRPSKDKKDATTMPVSDEVKKTQKKSKGPSALELVKKKYGKAVMKVGKKKVKEELDLTKVAEAFGGYIVEVKKQKPTQKDLSAAADKRKEEQRQQQQRANSPLQPGMDDEEGQGVGFSPKQQASVTKILDRIGTNPKQTAQQVKKDAPKPTRANYPKTRAELEAKRKEYGIDRQGRASDAGVERYARKTKQLSSGSNMPVTLTQNDLDTARKRMVGSATPEDRGLNKLAKAIGGRGIVGFDGDVGKYGGKLARRRPSNAPSYAEVKAKIDAKPTDRRTRTTISPDDFYDMIERERQKSPKERAARDKIINALPTDLGAERIEKEAEKNLKARDTVAKQAKVPDSIEDRLGMPPGSFQKRLNQAKNDSKPTGGSITDTIAKLDRGQQKSAVGATGGLLAKTFNPALAGVEAMGRYRMGDKKGAMISGIQALGGPIGFGAGVYNAFRKQTGAPITDPNRVRVTGDVSVNPPLTKKGKKVLDQKASEKGFKIDTEKPSSRRTKKKLGIDTAQGGGGKKPPDKPSGVVTEPQPDSGGGGTQRNTVSKEIDDTAQPLLSYQAFKDAGDSARKALGKIFDPKNLQTKKRTKTGRRSAGS